jgi:hypothetical protein
MVIVQKPIEILKRNGEVGSFAKTFPRGLFAEASKCSYFAQEREKHPQSLMEEPREGRIDACTRFYLL